jgi:hypothetical protein
VREWRQFRLLWTDALRKLLNAAVLGRDTDPAQYAIWTTAIVMAPPSLYAFGQLFKYGTMRLRPPEAVEAIVLSDRMFFVFYSMVAAALLAALTWEALFPDRTDQEIVGVLPVRPRTLAGARLAAALAMAALFATAVNLPGAVLFAFVSPTHPLLGTLPTVFVAHLLATVGGAVTVFAALLLVRGVTALVAGADIADRLATALQLLAIVSLVEVFFYLPSVIPFLVRHMLDGGAAAAWYPPAWFTAFYSAIVGTTRDVLRAEAVMATAAFGMAVVLSVPIYLLPACVMARRALESQSRQRPGPMSALAKPLLSLAPDGPRRAVAGFTVTSLMRGRRHLLIVVSYAGVGVAIAAIALIAARIRIGLVSAAPVSALLAAPLVVMFFIVLGLRAAFRIPTDLDANWSFRVAPPTTGDAGAGTGIALIALAVVPLSAAAAITALVSGWGIAAAVRVGLFDLASGVCLVEGVLIGWSIVPFACDHEPMEESMKYRWLLYLIPLNLFAFRGAALQAAALSSVTGSMLYVGGALALASLAHGLRRSRAHKEPLAFDAPSSMRLDVLNISEAME